MKGLTIALIAGLALVLAACGNNYRSNFSSDWCLSTDGLTFEESVWANEVCSRGDGNFNTFSSDGDDSPGNSGGKGNGRGNGGGNSGNCPGNSCDAPGRNK